MTTFLAIVGAITIVSGFFTLFSSLGRRPRKLTVTQALPVDSMDFLYAISGSVNAPLFGGGDSKLLNNGDEFFPALVEDLRAAKKTINFSAYIWEPGKASKMIADVLAERAEAGVQVRILLDAMGGLRAPKAAMKRIEAAGGKVQRFRSVTIGKLLRFYKRNHRRAIVIDGVVAYVGGAAVGDKWLGNARNEKEWRDSLVRVTDSIATNLQSAFTELWAYVCGEILVGKEFYPDLDPMNDSTDSWNVHVVSTPSSEEYPLRTFFFLTFAAAKERLYITTPYFVPDKQTREIVSERARAGVDVRILLPDHHTDAKPIRQASHHYFEELLASGVRLYEYQGTMMHTKGIVVDSMWSVVGSANMDIRSKELNDENVLGILDREFAAQMEETFVRDLERAEEIDPEKWSRRGIGARMKERFCVLFAEQY